MYTVYAIEPNYLTHVLYNDTTSDLVKHKILDPKLKLQDNSAGSFSCKIPQGNFFYDDIEPMTTTIRILRDDEWMWTGRVLSIKKDMWLNKTITCEGALAFLNDVALPQQKWSNVSIVTYVTELLTIFNSRVPTYRQIKVGAISTSTSSGSPISLQDYISEGESVLKHVSTLAEDWGLHIRIRENPSDHLLYLDMLTDIQLESNTQTINFGKNLLDYADETDWTDLVTVIHPYGAELDTHNITGDEDYPDKLTINGQTPSDTTTFGVYDNEYLYNIEAVSKFGRIEETVDWSEVDDAATLMSLAELYLNDFKYYNIKLTVKVLDLHYLNVNTDGIKFLSKIMCKSTPHNVNDEFIIDQMEIPFDKPEQTQFTFSRFTMGYYTSDRPNQGFGKGTISGISINTNTFSKGSILSSAKAAAAQMVLSTTHGYVSLNMDSNNDHVENLTITNQATQETSTQRWLWSMGGLMYQDRSSINADWNNPNVAITMDGQIVANMITTGVLQVAQSGGGVLFSANMNSKTVTIAGFTVVDTKMYTRTKTSIDSDDVGVYIGNDGFSTGNGSRRMSMHSGQLVGGRGTATSSIAMRESGGHTSLTIQSDSITFKSNNIYVEPSSTTPSIIMSAYSGTFTFTDGSNQTRQIIVQNGIIFNMY